MKIKTLDWTELFKQHGKDYDNSRFTRRIWIELLKDGIFPFFSQIRFVRESNLEDVLEKGTDRTEKEIPEERIDIMGGVCRYNELSIMAEYRLHPNEFTYVLSPVRREMPVVDCIDICFQSPEDEDHENVLMLVYSNFQLKRLNKFNCAVAYKKEAKDALRKVYSIKVR